MNTWNDMQNKRNCGYEKQRTQELQDRYGMFTQIFDADANAQNLHEQHDNLTDCIFCGWRVDNKFYRKSSVYGLSILFELTRADHKYTGQECKGRGLFGKAQMQMVVYADDTIVMINIPALKKWVLEQTGFNTAEELEAASKKLQKQLQEKENKERKIIEYDNMTLVACQVDNNQQNLCLEIEPRFIKDFCWIVDTKDRCLRNINGTIAMDLNERWGIL